MNWEPFLIAVYGPALMALGIWIGHSGLSGFTSQIKADIQWIKDKLTPPTTVTPNVPTT